MTTHTETTVRESATTGAARVSVGLEDLRVGMRALAVALAPRRVRNGCTTPEARAAMCSARVEVTEEGLMLTATDWDVWVRTRMVGEQVTGGGTVVLADHETLAGMVREIARSHRTVAQRRAARVVVEVTATGQVWLQSGDYAQSVPGEDAGLFPDVDRPVVPVAPTAALPRAVLADAARRAAAVADDGQTLPILTGTDLHVGDGRVRFVATDRYRLTSMALPADTTGPARRALPPAARLASAAAALTGEDATVTVHPGGQWLTIADQCTDLTLRCLAGIFPRTESIMAAAATVRATVDRKALADAAAQLKDHARTIHDIVRLTLTGTTATLTYHPEDTDAAPVTTTPVPLDVDAPVADFTIAFNYRFLTDALKAIPDDRITLHLSDPRRPMLITHPDQTPADTDATNRHAIMPIRIPS